MRCMPRAVAQLGSALDWGSRGRRFKSCQPDVTKKRVAEGGPLLRYLEPVELHLRAGGPTPPRGPGRGGAAFGGGGGDKSCQPETRFPAERAAERQVAMEVARIG